MLLLLHGLARPVEYDGYGGRGIHSGSLDSEQPPDAQLRGTLDQPVDRARCCFCSTDWRVLLSTTDTEVAEFIQDRWTLNSHLTLNFGARLTSQSIGRDAAFAPRIGASC